MPYRAWIDVGAEREKLTNGTPIVTVFGAGIAGLSVAHELVERGFAVQVVEARGDPDEEYTCLVGGLAASQLARTPADAPRLHSYLYSEAPGSEQVVATNAERSIRVWVVDTGSEILDVEIDGLRFQVVTDGRSKAEIAEAIRSQAGALGITAYVPTGAALPTVVVAGGNDPNRVPHVRIAVGADQALPRTVRYERVADLGALRARWMQETQARYTLPQRIQFERGYTGSWLTLRDAWGTPNEEKIVEIWNMLKTAYASFHAARRAAIVETGLEGRLSDRMQLREELLVELRGHTDGNGLPHDNRADSGAWAQAVRQELLNRNVSEGSPIPRLEDRLVTVGVGDAEPIGNPRTDAGRRRTNRVELRIVENVIPGEHGYRFFPRFYRHLFDTMKRTPVLGPDGGETGLTAFDQLAATTILDLGFFREAALADTGVPGEGADPETVPVRRPRSLEEVRHLVRIHFERFGISERDVFQLLFRLAKFLTSSEARRKTYERRSWWEFLGADDPGRYTERMRQVLRDTPQALVAMDAEETDARTQGAIYCQLLFDWLSDDPATNRTLSGPTSRAWLDGWKRYLKRQGVRFFTGKLEELLWVGGELVPLVTFGKGFGPDVPVVVTDPGLVSIFLLEQTVQFESPAGEMETRDRSLMLAEAIEANPDLPVLVDRVDPAIRIRPRFPAGEVALTVDERADGPVTLTVNGLELDVDGTDPASLRAALLDAARELEGEGLFGEKFGERSVHLAPDRESMIVSVTSMAAGEFGLRVAGSAVTVVSSHAAQGDPSAVRDQLLDVLRAAREQDLAIREALGEDPAPFGKTGIRLRGRQQRPPVELGEWAGRLQFGPDVRVTPGKRIIVAHGGSVTVSARTPAVGVVGVAPESRGGDFVEAPSTGAGPARGGGPDFYVLAVPLEEASRLVWEAWHLRPPGAKLDGVFEQLRKFDQETGRRDSEGKKIEPRRDGSGRPIPSHDPFRDLSGIQYYFDNHVRIGTGHSYFVDAPWGLSSIAQLAWWKERMSQGSAFLGQLSVDLGNWYRTAERVVASSADTSKVEVHPEAWRSSKREIAAETWRQIKDGLDPFLAAHVVDPTWYHLDDAIRFEENGARAFGRPTVVRETPPSATAPDEPSVLRIGDTEVEVPAGTLEAGKALRGQIETSSDHLARELPATEGARVLIAPVSTGTNRVRVVVLEAIPGVEYRIAVNRHVASYVAVDGDGIEDVRDGLVHAVLESVPGVVAEKDAAPPWGGDGKRGIRLSSTRAIRVSALAVRSAPAASVEERSLLATVPGGVVVITPKSRLRLETPDDAAPIRNDARFLINNPDWKDENTWHEVWRSRPGIRMKSKPLPLGAPAATDIFYAIEQKRWLMVGNHMATYTRLSTMESANESARHAVIAILLRLREGPGDGTLAYNGQGRLLGDLPAIWNPEDHELDDTAPWKRLDARLMQTSDAAGEPLPHFLDILKLGDWIDGLPADYRGMPEDWKFEQLLSSAREQLARDWRFSGLEEIEALLPAALRALLGKGPGGGGSP